MTQQVSDTHPVSWNWVQHRPFKRRICLQGTQTIKDDLCRSRIEYHIWWDFVFLRTAVLCSLRVWEHTLASSGTRGVYKDHIPSPFCILVVRISFKNIVKHHLCVEERLRPKVHFHFRGNSDGRFDTDSFSRGSVQYASQMNRLTIWLHIVTYGAAHSVSELSLETMVTWQ